MNIMCNEKRCKLVIDGGSAMNVISTHTITRANLKTEPHPEPFHVSWVNHTSLPITSRCLVPIKIGSYEDQIWCDVLPMDIAHILLGRPWLYDLNVIHYGRENTYIFKYNNKIIKLLTIKPLNKIPSITPHKSHSHLQPNPILKKGAKL